METNSSKPVLCDFVNFETILQLASTPMELGYATNNNLQKQKNTIESYSLQKTEDPTGCFERLAEYIFSLIQRLCRMEGEDKYKFGVYDRTAAYFLFCKIHLM